MKLRTEFVLITVSSTLGVVFGIGLAKGIDYNFFSAFGAMLAGGSTLGTWYIASRALHSWKDKTAYTEYRNSLENALSQIAVLKQNAAELRDSFMLLSDESSYDVEFYRGLRDTVTKAISVYRSNVMTIDLLSDRLGIDHYYKDLLAESRKDSTIRKRFDQAFYIAFSMCRGRSFTQHELSEKLEGLDSPLRLSNSYIRKIHTECIKTL